MGRSLSLDPGQRRSQVLAGMAPLAALELRAGLSVPVATITGMKLRLLRVGDLLDEDTVLVRGGELDPDVRGADARRYHGVYGTYGISVFAMRGMALEEMAQQVPLVRFRGLTLITAGELIRSGLRLEPTGRNPQHYTVGFDDLGQGVKVLTDCRHQVLTNPYYDG